MSKRKRDELGRDAGEQRQGMRRVKIICTIGPASNSKKVITRLVRSGMDVARLNFSHGTHEDHRRAVRSIREASAKFSLPVAILQDLKGLKIRVGTMKNGVAVLRKNATFTLTTHTVEGDSKQVSVSYPHLVRDVHVGDTILLDDGLLQLKVTGKKKNKVVTRVKEGGELKAKKGVNLLGARISGTVFTKKDREDLEFGLRIGVDYVAMSFVRSKEDVLSLKNWLRKRKADIPVIAKIEKPQALDDIDNIITASDGLMIARGDLGVEVNLEEVPLIQKELIDKCNRAMKPVITATQMLESMTEHMRPTRAEATDVANAVLDGTDALMLSGETAVGLYPVEAQKMMARIIHYTEKHRPGSLYPGSAASKTFAQAIAEAACIAALEVKARAIVCFSRSGFTALLVSKFRPVVPIVCFTGSEDVRKRMSLYWGVMPLIMKFPGSTDEMIAASEKTLLRKGLARKRDNIVIIATSPFTLGGKTNIMKLHKVGF
jgi:pyruvate kinase